MKVIIEKLWTEPVVVASLLAGIGALYEGTVVGAVLVVVGGVLLRTLVSPVALVRARDEKSLRANVSAAEAFGKVED
jgi:hypothetical protein